MKSTSIPIRLLGAALALSTLTLPLPALASSHANSNSMSMDMSTAAPVVPAVHGFVDGEAMLFMHTEVSDASISKILVEMMGGSPVPVVPSLADIPAEFLAPVYVFTNGYSGMWPMGPLGGQPDIFVGVPGQAGYSPLRSIITVTWVDGVDIVELRSFAQLKAAIDKGAVSTQVAGVVVNMPMLTWPGGSR